MVTALAARWLLTAVFAPLWPLLADAFAHLWDLPEPPSPDEVIQAFGAE